MALRDIPVVSADPPGVAEVPTGNGPPLLREISARLDGLLRRGEDGSIDLRGLPLSAADRRWLEEALGDGEVLIRVDAAGRSTLRETGYPGVWWVEHRDGRDVLTGEFIEVAFVPEWVRAHPDDVAAGLGRLAAYLADMAAEQPGGD